MLVTSVRLLVRRCVCVCSRSRNHQAAHTNRRKSGKELIKFGFHPPLNVDPGLFRRILQHCEMGHFTTTMKQVSNRSLSWDDDDDDENDDNDNALNEK